LATPGRNHLRPGPQLLSLLIGERLVVKLYEPVGVMAGRIVRCADFEQPLEFVGLTPAPPADRLGGLVIRHSDHKAAEADRTTQLTGPAAIPTAITTSW